MRLAGGGGLLVVHCLRDKRRLVAIVPSLAEALGSWTPTSRVSPIFELADTPSEAPRDEHFAGEHTLYLIGPTHPVVFCDSLPPTMRCWATLGAFNLLIHVSGEPAQTVTSVVEERARNLNVRFERWTVVDGEIIEDYSPFANPEPDPALKRLAALSHARGLPHDLRDTVNEFCALMATSLSRAAQAAPLFIPRLRETITLIEEGLRDITPQDHSQLYSVLGVLIQTNAGLSRFTSQTFSGCSPVSMTECHFWIHSLLGSGTANIAIHNLCEFIETKLGLLRIPQRLENLARQQKRLPDLHHAPGDFWYEGHLATIPLSLDQVTESLVPILTFLSGRDGFSSTLNTLSAPLAVVSSCNTVQWSLITLTHEISHIVIRAVLNTIYVDYKSPEGAAFLTDYANNTFVAANWLDAVRQYLVDTIAAIHKVATRIDPERNVAALRHTLQRWHKDVQELFVHIFDFLYFYGQDTERYLASIWLSWDVIPNIGSRIPEYLFRTLCVVLSQHLRRGEDAEEVTRQQVLSYLEALNNKTKTPYVTEAIHLLKDETGWLQYYRPGLLARKGVVKLARGFLFWDAAGAEFRSEDTLGPGGGRQGYQWKIGTIPDSPISNPLRFVEAYATASVPSDSASLWMLICLAFGLKGHGPNVR